MVKLRLKRLGSKKAPTYRIVAADSRSPRDGRIIDTVGLYTLEDVPRTRRTTDDHEADTATQTLQHIPPNQAPQADLHQELGLLRGLDLGVDLVEHLLRQQRLT